MLLFILMKHMELLVEYWGLKMYSLGFPSHHPEYVRLSVPREEHAAGPGPGLFRGPVPCTVGTPVRASVSAS